MQAIRLLQHNIPPQIQFLTSQIQSFISFNQNLLTMLKLSLQLSKKKKKKTKVIANNVYLAYKRKVKFISTSVLKMIFLYILTQSNKKEWKTIKIINSSYTYSTRADLKYIVTEPSSEFSYSNLNNLQLPNSVKRALMCKYSMIIGFTVRD